MIEISPEVFVGGSLKVGTIYYFSSEALNTTEPHYFVVLNASQRVILACATTKFETAERFVKKNGFPDETLVKISPDSKNGLKKESLFNCNNFFEETAASLMKKYQLKNLKIKGVVSQSDLEKLLNGIKKSLMISNEIKNLL